MMSWGNCKVDMRFTGVLRRSWDWIWPLLNKCNNELVFEYLKRCTDAM